MRCACGCALWQWWGLDACGGYYGPSSQDEYVYRCHTTGEAHEANTEAQCAAPHTDGSEFYPFTPACLAGCVPDELITALNLYLL